MKTVKIRESKVIEYMAKHGYIDVYDMKDKLLYNGKILQIIPDLDKNKMKLYRKQRRRRVLAFAVTIIWYLPFIITRLIILPAIKLIAIPFYLIALEPRSAAITLRTLFKHDKVREL